MSIDAKTSSILVVSSTKGEFFVGFFVVGVCPNQREKTTEGKYGLLNIKIYVFKQGFRACWSRYLVY